MCILTRGSSISLVSIDSYLHQLNSLINVSCVAFMDVGLRTILPKYINNDVNFGIFSVVFGVLYVELSYENNLIIHPINTEPVGIDFIYN